MGNYNKIILRRNFDFSGGGFKHPADGQPYVAQPLLSFQHSL